MSDSVAPDGPIACTLTGRTFEHRIRWIGELARDCLRGYEHDDLMLRLRYTPLAAERVRQMVRDEQACCGFLKFDLRETPDELMLTIKAPAAARGLAVELFAHFVGGNSRSTRGCPDSAPP